MVNYSSVFFSSLVIMNECTLSAIPVYSRTAIRCGPAIRLIQHVSVIWHHGSWDDPLREYSPGCGWNSWENFMVVVITPISWMAYSLGVEEMLHTPRIHWYKPVPLYQSRRWLWSPNPSLSKSIGCTAFTTNSASFMFFHPCFIAINEVADKNRSEQEKTSCHH